MTATDTAEQRSATPATPITPEAARKPGVHPRPSPHWRAGNSADTSPDTAAENSSTSKRPRTEASLREQKKARARASILDSATQLIGSNGYAQTKMRDVAAAANMSYQTLYNYFPTKGLILQELLTQDLDKLHHASVSTLTSQNPLNTKLRELAKNYIDAIAPNDRHLWKEVCAELLKVTSHHSCLLALLDEQALPKLRDLLDAAQKQGELDPHVDSVALAGVVFSLLDASLMRYLVNEKMTRPGMLSTLSEQLRLTITPYLR